MRHDRISIFGLGYVGTVCLACLARDGHEVVGVDIDPAKLVLIQDGRSPIVEEGMEALVAHAVTTGRLSVTADAMSAVRDTDVSFICVGTPSAANGSQDHSAIVKLAHDLGRAVRDKDDHLFVFRSTLVPGTVEDVLVPILEREAGTREGEGFQVCVYPAFLREGTSIRDYDEPPLTIVGANREAPAGRLRRLFGHLPCEFHTTSIRAAETVKYCCNNFHALKVTFANETARLCEALGVDAFEVMTLVCLDRELNISPAYLTPGFAFGGSCLPKDLRATLHLSKVHDVELPVHAGILQSNRAHIEHATAKVLASHRRRIGMIGLSFKTGTDDLRDSPLVLMAERFIAEGLHLLVYDPQVHLSRLLGANRRFIEQHLPQLGSILHHDLEQVVAESDLLVLGLNDPRVFDALARHVRADQVVLDLVHLPNPGALRGDVVGLAW